MPTVDVNEMHQLAFDKTGSGPALVAIHGIGGHKEDWISFADTLSKDYTVYTVDMLGFGESSKSGGIITIDDQVSAIVKLLDSEGIEKADIVGNSVGGWVAATLAANHSARVHKLVLVDAAGFKAMFEGNPPVDFYPKDSDAMANLLAHVRHDPVTQTPEFIENALNASLESGDDIAAEAVGKGLFVSERLEDVCDRIIAPTLVVWGEEDRLFPSAISALVAGHSRAESTILISGASHFPQLDKPAEFEAAVASFLKQQNN